MDFNNMKILDASTFDFSQSALIKPPFQQPTNKEVASRSTRVVIDSRDRDEVAYPYPHTYVVQIESEIEEVISADIIAIDVPLSRYFIHEHNNSLTCNGTVVTLDVGNFNNTTLGTNFANALSIATSSTFTIVYDDIKDKYTISNASEFTLCFDVTNAKIFGYSHTIAYQSTSGNLTSPYRIDLSGDKFIICNIEMMNINNSANRFVNQSTVVVNRGDVYNNTKNLTIPIKKVFNPPIARLTKLKVKFVDFFGNNYDFQNQDHRIELMFDSRRQLSRYTNFV
jgi:hypothetical protein